MFLQSQDFQRHTEVLINNLYRSSQHAAEQLHAVDLHLVQSLSTMDIVAGSLSSVESAQHQQLQLSQDNLKGVQQLQDDSQQVHAQLAHAMHNEVSLSCRSLGPHNPRAPPPHISLFTNTAHALCMLCSA